MATDTFLLDVNVLIALAWPTHVHHERAHAWFANVEHWATCSLTESAFVRLSTNVAVVGERIPVAAALSVLNQIRSVAGHRFVIDDSSFGTPAISFDRVVTSSQITDAHLVNLAADADLVLATLDRGIPEMLVPADHRHVMVVP